MVIANSSYNTNQGFFFQKNERRQLDVKNEIINSIKSNLYLNEYDQYTRYFYAKGYSAENYFVQRIESLIFADSGDSIFFYDIRLNGPYLIGISLSDWDEEHFGFKMAKLNVLTTPKELTLTEDVLYDLMNKAINYLKEIDVTFVSARINGDNIRGLHAAENVGFRYYDNVIWPLAKVEDASDNHRVRFFKAEDLEQIKQIAKNYQYSRGHYYCDERFSKDKVDAMYLKWIDTTIKNKEHITVIESKGKVAGFFVFKFDDDLEKKTGYKYGRLRLLALNSTFRGEGLGKELFSGTLSLIKKLGADFIDSGYSTKNHISSRLHGMNSFYSVYEEVTFHLWLNNSIE